MPRENLTDNRLKALKPAASGQRYVIMDAQVPNMGVRVTDKAPLNGSKMKAGQVSFIYVARFGGAAQPARRALGEYDIMSLDAARTKAREWAALIDRGIDPKEKDAEEKRLAEAARRERENGASERRKKQFERVLARYIAARRRDGIRKVEEDRNDFKRECLPAWRGRAVGDIQSADVMAVLEKINKRGATRQALNMAQKIGTFFNWCVDDELISASPFRAKKVRTMIGEKTSRDRVLSDAEIAALWTATAAGDVYSAVYRLLLLTGQRLNDIAQASWSEIDLDRKTLTVPAARFKSGRDHVVPLTDDAIEIIGKLPRFKKCDWLCSLDGQGPVTIGHKVKMRIDAAMLAALREDNPEATVPAWVNHDIRRTVRTRLSELDVMDEVAEAVIGHVPTALVRTYNQSDRLKVKRDALTRWEGALASIVGEEKASNVVAMAGRASA
ncbi:tyrosine-type recombinase/integrase [Mesorhizobium sp. 113-3-3]|uniref:tyrosine-type recombinase/integrase n=1 Tax=Mesorhizobium sp. 113-3-3 TaxID=2744516 RepID=UPI0019281BE2|nr:site-specific integrase [Mesorhizobium sp. 113-3-3]BCG80082.1 integrase [Mesorhizobium sp. 113-3-3]